VALRAARYGFEDEANYVPTQVGRYTIWAAAWCYRCLELNQLSLVDGKFICRWCKDARRNERSVQPPGSMPRSSRYQDLKPGAIIGEPLSRRRDGGSSI